MTKDIEIMKSLFCSSIKLNDNDFKQVYNFMLTELKNNPDMYKMEFNHLNFSLLIDNTSKKLSIISEVEISKISNLFAGFYIPSFQRLRNYNYYILQ